MKSLNSEKSESIEMWMKRGFGEGMRTGSIWSTKADEASINIDGGWRERVCCKWYRGQTKASEFSEAASPVTDAFSLLPSFETEPA